MVARWMERPSPHKIGTCSWFSTQHANSSKQARYNPTRWHFSNHQKSSSENFKATEKTIPKPITTKIYTPVPTTCFTIVVIPSQGSYHIVVRYCVNR